MKFGGVIIESARVKGDKQDTVYITPDQKKLDDFLDLETPASKTECQMICGTAAQLKKFLPGM